MEKHQVYVIDCNGKVKIGYSAVASARIKDIQASNPFPLATIEVFPIGHEGLARSIERNAHDELKEFRIKFGKQKTEWFNVHHSIATTVVSKLVERSKYSEGRLTHQLAHSAPRLKDFVRAMRCYRPILNRLDIPKYSKYDYIEQVIRKFNAMVSEVQIVDCFNGKSIGCGDWSIRVIIQPSSQFQFLIDSPDHKVDQSIRDVIAPNCLHQVEIEFSNDVPSADKYMHWFKVRKSAQIAKSKRELEDLHKRNPESVRMDDFLRDIKLEFMPCEIDWRIDETK